MSSMKVVVTDMIRQNLIQQALERIAGDWQSALKGNKQPTTVDQAISTGVTVDKDANNSIDVYAGYLTEDSANTLEMTPQERRDRRTQVSMKVDGRELGLVGDIGMRKLSNGKFSFLYDSDNAQLNAFVDDVKGLYNVLEQIEDAKRTLGANISAHPERRPAKHSECGGKTQWRAVVSVDRQQLIARQILAR